LPAGKQTDAMCYLFDLMPTLGKLCNVTGPSTSDGISFDATLKDPAAPARSEIFLAYKEVQRSVRDERWKLIRYPVVDKTQLFDLKTDPYETTNLADKPGQARRVAAMMEMLAEQQAKFGDKDPLKVSNPKPAAWSPPASAQPKQVAAE
jgi:arylsulfatase A-like enzyme